MGECGLKINVKKTKMMKISKRFTIFLEGKQLSQNISHLNYLGSIITQQRSCEKEIRSRIARAKNTFKKRKELLT